MFKGSGMLRRAARWIPFAAVEPFVRPTALFFHGVAPRIEDARIEINHHSLEAFRTIALELKRRFQVLPLHAIDDVLKRPERHARTVFLMSDDGYANTLGIAADLLDELNLPWTLFVSTEHIDTDALNPLILARLFFYYAPDGSYTIPHLDSPIDLKSARLRASRAAPILSALKNLDAEQARESIAAMRNAFPNGRLAELRARFFSERYLSWDEVAVLHRRGVEIGAHAHWHWPMNQAQPPDKLREQASVPRRAIIARLGRCSYFSYPFGNVGDVCPAAWRAVRDAGYSHAFTTLSGTLGAGLNPWLLPRYGLRAKEPHLRSLLPLLRLGDARVARFSAANVNGIPAPP